MSDERFETVLKPNGLPVRVDWQFYPLDFEEACRILGLQSGDVMPKGVLLAEEKFFDGRDKPLFTQRQAQGWLYTHLMEGNLKLNAKGQYVIV